MSDSAILRLYRRIMMMVGRGRVTVVDDTGAVQKVQLDFLSPLEVRDGTPRLLDYGFTSYPPSNTDAVVLFVGGDRSNGVIIATGNQTFRLKGLATGDVALYDSRGQSITLTATGIVVNGNGLNLTVNNTPVVTINAATDIVMNTPLLKVSGDILDNSGTNSDTIAGMRAVFNAHVHGGVLRGAQVSDPPTTVQ